MRCKANWIQILQRKITPALITVQDGVIESIEVLGDSPDDSLPYVLPGFIDAHIHIESSMLVPSEFARLATPHGTVAVVTDPHEIANVLGVAGIDFMIDNANQVPLKCNFGAPSCVPATSFETSGATIDAAAIGELLERDDIGYLAEMMNYPGVLQSDAEVLAKLDHAKRLGKPIDGHAPGVTGDDAIHYIAAGITTDHECTEYSEAVHKRDHGMKILIREGSAAKNFDALHALISESPADVMFCSDDKHPDDLAIGHINLLVRRAIELGHDLFDVLRVACINPIEHYRLNVGQLRVGDPADMIVVDDIKQWSVSATYIDGKLVAENGQSRIDSVDVKPINQFHCSEKSASDFAVNVQGDNVPVIGAVDGSLVTLRDSAPFPIVAGDDVLKLSVINRYDDGAPAVAWIRGFGIKRGAIASCVGHDSHNILAVGADDESLAKAVNQVIAQQGGIAAVSDDESVSLPLPIAGIMSGDDGHAVAKKYEAIDAFAKEQLGCTLTAPFMTLSFMALLVIPSLKLSDQGLFDGESFAFVE